MLVMMAYVGLNENLKTGIWTKCASTGNKLEKIMVNPHLKNVLMRSSTVILQTMQNTLRLFDKWELYASLSE